ncbi:MAG: tautomerase family protein [Planctomycetota bacterium]
MPLYLTTLAPERSTEAQRAAIAACITEVHVDVTGAPVQFVNTFFGASESAADLFEPLPPGRVALVNGGIRAGRPPEAKAEMIDRIARGVADALGCDAEEVAVVLHPAPAQHGMEGGELLPEPGSPEESAWKAKGVSA